MGVPRTENSSHIDRLKELNAVRSVYGTHAIQARNKRKTEWNLVNKTSSSQNPPCSLEDLRDHTESELKVFRMSRWRKGKSVPNSPCLDRAYWTPLHENTWCDTTGRQVTLSPTSLLDLTDVERVSLQKIAFSRLQKTSLDASITIPKEWSKTKKNRFLLKRRIAGSASLSETGSNSSVRDLTSRSKSSKGTDRKSNGWVFGIPLGKCISNDSELQRADPEEPTGRRNNDNHQPDHRKSCSLAGEYQDLNESHPVTDNVKLENRPGTNRSHLVDALLLSLTSQLGSTNHRRDNIKNNRHLLVPYIVKVCCQYLTRHGCGVIGIFRIGCSKKRTIQLRDEFDSGRSVDLASDDNINPHDVAAILKEYFRDLPDPLFTKDLYSAFVATRKLNDCKERLQCLTLLTALLPTPNRDTLWTLLSFLHHISNHSNDSVDIQGNVVTGNKMNSHNLATLFGPNILHKAKAGQGQFQVESMERAEEREEVIAVVEEMINLHQKIFQLSADLHDEILRSILLTKPDVIDSLLKKISADIRIDPEPESFCSIYDDSDSSSIANSPSYLNEPSPTFPRTLIEALQPPMFFPPTSWSPPAGRTFFRSPPSGRRKEETEARGKSVSDVIRSNMAAIPGSPSLFTNSRDMRTNMVNEYEKHLKQSPKLSSPAQIKSPLNSRNIDNRDNVTVKFSNNLSYASPRLSSKSNHDQNSISRSPNTDLHTRSKSEITKGSMLEKASPKSILSNRPSAPKQELLIQITSDEYTEDSSSPITSYSNVDALITNPPFRQTPRRSRRSYGVPHGSRVAVEGPASPRSISTPRSKQLPSLLTVPFSKHSDGSDGVGCGSLSSLSSRSSRSFSPSPSPDSLSPARKAATQSGKTKPGKVEDGECSSSSKLRPLGITSSLHNPGSNDVTSWFKKWDKQTEDRTRLNV